MTNLKRYAILSKLSARGKEEAGSKLSLENKKEPWKLKIEQYTNPEDSKHKAGFGLGFEKNSEQNQSNEGLKQLAKLIV